MHRTEPATEGADDWTDESSVVGAPATRAAATDYDLVVALVDGGASAFERFVERFHRILFEYARREGVRPSESDELVSETLGDVAMRFMTARAALPRNPRMYLLAAFRRRLINHRRSHLRRQRVVAEAARDAMGDCVYADESDVVVGCSEHLVRECRGPDWEKPSLPSVLERLADHLTEALTEDERHLLVGVAENVPQRVIAGWLGISHALARKRLERLRSRLLDAAMRRSNGLPPDDARELDRFFRRCGARIGAAMLAGAIPTVPSSHDAMDHHTRSNP